MADQKLNITLNVEGITLPVTVSSVEEEKVYRDAASLIQQRVQRFRTIYPSLPSDKYYYVMAMLNIGVDAVRAANEASTEPYRKTIDDLVHEIDLLNLNKKK